MARIDARDYVGADSDRANDALRQQGRAVVRSVLDSRRHVVFLVFLDHPIRAYRGIDSLWDAVGALEAREPYRSAIFMDSPETFLTAAERAAYLDPAMGPVVAAVLRPDGKTGAEAEGALRTVYRCYRQGDLGRVADVDRAFDLA